MALIKCTNKKKYNLTVGKEYEASLVEGDFYSLINDRGAKAKYSADMFEVIREDAVIPPAAPIPPVPKVFNPANLSLEIDDRSLEDEGDFHVTFKYLGGDIDIEESFNMNLYASPISCGIFQINGINAFLQCLEEFTEELVEQNFTGGIDTSLITGFFIRDFCMQVRDINGYIYILSTNRESGLIEVWDEHFIGSISEMYNNPNSGNNIRIYTIYPNS